MPKVSIVLPSYNGSKYIKESINSIQEQTFKDWELIIVDDCSEDNTLEIVKDYERYDNRIQVIHNKINVKLPGALNIGFKYASGKYLTWTSDDNMYLPKALEVMVQSLDSMDTAMVCADEYAITSDGQMKWNTTLRYKDDELCWRNSVGACFLYRRDVLTTVGEYDMDLYGVEDYDYWLRIKNKYGEITRIGQVLYKYRYHEMSLSSVKKEMIRQALIQLRKKHLDFILDDLKNRQDLLYTFYYEMLERHTIDEEIRTRIRSFCPELQNDVLGKHGKYIVFGAGEYGEEAESELREKVFFFADNNPDKIGKYKNKKEILSFDKMISMSKHYNIMVAIHSNNIYPLIRQLLDKGIEFFCTWQTYVFEHSQMIE